MTSMVAWLYKYVSYLTEKDTNANQGHNTCSWVEHHKCSLHLQRSARFPVIVVHCLRSPGRRYTRLFAFQDKDEIFLCTFESTLSLS